MMKMVNIIVACVAVFFWKTSPITGAVDDICNYVESCGSTCDCVLDEHCAVCNGGQGCSICDLNYFSPDTDQKCMSCALLDGCLSCHKEYGCETCDSSRNCVRRKSNLCNIWTCDECDPLPSESPTAKPTKAPTDSPTNNPSDYPTNTPTKEPSNNPTNYPTDKPTNEPSDKPTDAPTKEPSAQPTNVPTIDHNTVEHMTGLLDAFLGGAMTVEIASAYFTSDFTALIDGYGEANWDIFSKFIGICDISAKTAVEYLDVAEYTHSKVFEYHTCCESSVYGEFWIHAIWYIISVGDAHFDPAKFIGIHFLQPTNVEYIVDALNA